MYEKGKTDIDDFKDAISYWVILFPITLYKNWINLGMICKSSGLDDRTAFEVWDWASRTFDPAGYSKTGNMELMRHKWAGFKSNGGLTKNSVFSARKQLTGSAMRRTDGTSETSTQKPTAPAYTETHGEPARDARTDGAIPAPTETQKTRTEPERAPRREDHWRDHVVKNPNETYKKLHEDGHTWALEFDAPVPNGDPFLYLPKYMQLDAFLTACYKDGDSVGIVGADCIFRNGEKFSYTAPKYPRNVKEIKDTARLTHSVSKAVGTDTNGPAGACIKLNPYNGLKFDTYNLTSFSNGLAEGDSETQTRDEFLDVIIVKCALPVKAIVFSGNKSYHVIFDVGVNFDPTKTAPADAQKEAIEAKREYERRVKLAHAFIKAEGGDVDPQTVDPTHGTRLPGAMRDGTEQSLLLTGEMIKGICRTWDEWEAWAKTIHPELWETPAPVQTSAPATEPATKKDTAPKTDGEKRTPQVYTFTNPQCDPNPVELDPELIRGIMREGGTLELAGKVKSQKSFFLLALSTVATRGLGTLGIDFTKKCNILYVDPENNPKSFKDRAQKMRDAMLADQPNDIKFDTKHNFNYMNIKKRQNLHDTVDDIIASVQADGRHFDIIILDSLYRFFKGGNESDPATWDMVIDEVERLKEALHCAVFYSHHMTKGDQSEKDARDMGSGSNYQGRFYDAFIGILPLIITPNQRAKYDWGRDARAYEISFVCRDFPEPETFRVLFKDNRYQEPTDELNKQLRGCKLNQSEFRQAQNQAQQSEDAQDHRQEKLDAFRKVFTDAGTDTLTKDEIINGLKWAVVFSGTAPSTIEKDYYKIINENPQRFEKVPNDTTERNGKTGKLPDKIRLIG